MSDFVRRHTPVVEMHAPLDLAQLPLADELPACRFWLWCPGVGGALQRRWQREYPTIYSVHLERRFLENRVVFQLEPRIPLARWQGRGVDADGVIFPVDLHRWASLRTANLSEPDSVTALARWMVLLARVPAFWDEVVALRQDSTGGVWLDLRSGARVAWGPPDTETADAEARSLCRVLDDAHRRLGGAVRADARFFAEGRIIVRPKSAASGDLES